MADVVVELLESGERGGRYTAYIEIKFRDKRYPIRLTRLARKPVELRHEVKGEYLHVYLLDDKGEGIGTCCIHVGHLERGCIDCPSLISPPK